MLTNDYPRNIYAGARPAGKTPRYALPQPNLFPSREPWESALSFGA